MDSNPNRDRDLLCATGCHFVRLEKSRLRQLKENLRKWGKRLQLTGTVVLSPDGLRLSVSGLETEVRKFLAALQQDTGIESFNATESHPPSSASQTDTFHVRIRNQVVSLNSPDLTSLHHQSRSVDPQQLQHWLGVNRKIILFDVRNDYEIAVGTFRKAQSAGIRHFKDFPMALRSLPAEMMTQTVVVFCHDGIRSGKAATLMESRGFKNIICLAGGILRYFEAVGDAFFEGRCFVFDHRVAVDAGFHQPEIRICPQCRAVLLPEDLNPLPSSDRDCCRHCFKRQSDTSAALSARTESLIAQYTTTLPGSEPYDNVRTLKIPAKAVGSKVIDFLDLMKFRPPDLAWESIMAMGRLTFNDQPLKPDDILLSGGHIIHHVPGTVEPPVNTAITVIYEDESLLVLNKPAPLPVHPSGRFNRNTLQYIVSNALKPVPLRCAHRLDANTWGVIVLSKSREVASILQPEFENGNVVKEYRALVHGCPTQSEFICSEPVSRESTMAGGRFIDPNGLQATTGFSLIHIHGNDTALLRVRLLSGGRTHQIRLHLWHLGYPVVGDPLYLADHRRGQIQTLSPDDFPMCLQSCSIEFIHPTRGCRVRFEAPLPPWCLKDASH